MKECKFLEGPCGAADHPRARRIQAKHCHIGVIMEQLKLTGCMRIAPLETLVKNDQTGKMRMSKKPKKTISNSDVERILVWTITSSNGET